MGDTGRILRTAPWRRAPLLVGRMPLLAALVGGVAAVTGFVAAAPRLYEGSVAVASLESQIDPICPGSTIHPSTRSNVGPATAGLAELVAERPDTFAAPKVSSVYGLRTGANGRSSPPLVDDGDRGLPIALGSRTGFRDHLGLSGTLPTDGIFLPATLAEAAGVTAGDTISIEGSQARAAVRVAGVFPDLTIGRLPDEWCALQPVLREAQLQDELVPPTIGFLDADELDALVAQLGLRSTFVAWEAPIIRDLREQSQAESAAADVEELQRAARSLELRPGVSVALSSRLPFVVERARAMRASVASGILPVTVVSMVSTAALFAGAAAFWVARRHTDLRLFWARGVAPWLLGVKALLEVSIPAIAGLAAGTLVAWPVVGAFGPGSALEPGALPQAFVRAAAAGAVALGVFCAVVVARTRRGLLARTAALHHHVPLWPLLAAGLAWSWWQLGNLRLPVPSGDDLAPTTWVTFVAPVVFLVCATGLAVVAIRAVLASVGRRAERLPVTPYLAVRRIASASAVVVVLVTAAGLAVGIVVYGAGLTGSARATIHAKLATGNGAETAAYLLPPGVPKNLDGRATLVKAREGRFGDGGADEVVDVLAVDPATFADAAFWDESFADRPLAALLAPLATPRQDGPIPAIAIGELPDRGELSFPQLGQPPEEIELTGRARAFPAMGWTTPMLVVSADHLPGVFANQAPILWTSGTADEVEAGRQPGQRLIWATTLDAQVDTSVFQPVIWIFRYVQALGVLVAVLAAATLLAYLGASAPARDLATGLLRRMGMGLTRQWWAVACELGLLALMAGLTGVLGGWLAVRALRQLADAAPAVPPAGLLRFPLSTVAVAALVAVVVVAVGATVAIGRSARRNLAEVLRGDV